MLYHDDFPYRLEDFIAFDKMKNRIIFRLINYERNEKLLRVAPHLRLFDLALTFRWIAHVDDIGLSTALITDRECKLWNVTVKELILAAGTNTKRLFPPVIKDIRHYLKDEKEPIDTGGISMYVLTNEQQICGATALIYEGVPEIFAKAVGGDYYILPSSIHELLLIPAGELPKNPCQLCGMVRTVNAEVVSPRDILSDSVYYYDKTKSILRIFDGN